MKECIFLMGAGASVDAGMPMVADLTRDLRQLLPQLNDVNGNPRPEYGEVFDLLAADDSPIAGNYEKFFECIKLLLDVQKDPLGKVVHVKIPPKLNDAIFHLPSVLGEGVSQLLLSRTVKPDYLAKLADFIPAQGRLKVFSLNYDCCLEDACESQRINIATGFDPTTHRWNPSLFLVPTPGINLYKLHSSLRWRRALDKRQNSAKTHSPPFLVELKAGQYLPSEFEVQQTPELILGPGNKMQPDDPFITLFYEFHRSLEQACACVVIGYGYKDPHINTMLEHALDSGIKLLDVNPSQHVSGRYIAESGYSRLPLKAKDALTNGRVSSELSKLLRHTD